MPLASSPSVFDCHSRGCVGCVGGLDGVKLFGGISFVLEVCDNVVELIWCKQVNVLH